MRKLIAYGIMLGICVGMFAQGGAGTIPNASFEQYSTVSIPVPSNWEHNSEAFKVLYMDKLSYGVSQATPGYSGNYGLRIEVPNTIGDTFFAQNIVELPSLLTPPFLELWSVSFRYQYFPQNVGDTATVLILGFDDTLGISAFGAVDIGGTAASYTLASGNILVNLSLYDKAANVRYWATVIVVNPGCTLVLDSISIKDGSGNAYTAFPDNPDFESWYTASLDTFKYWITDIPFRHEVAPSPFGPQISTISGTSFADGTDSYYGGISAIIKPAVRWYVTDTPYNSLILITDLSSAQDIDFAYKYSSNLASDSATAIFFFSDANSSNIIFDTTILLPQTNSWSLVSVPFTTACPGCVPDTVMVAFVPVKAYVDSVKGIVALPGDTAAVLKVDMAVAGCVDTLPQANFAYSTNNLTITVLDSSTAADSIIWDFGDGTTMVGGDSVTYTYASQGTYSVCQYAFNTCQQSDTACVSVSVTPVSAGMPSASDGFKLVSRGNEYEFIADMDIEQVQVVNAAGKVLKNEKLGSKTRTYKLDLSKFGKGVYFVKVNTIKGTDLIKVTVR